MEWIQTVAEEQEEKLLLKGIDKLTFYDHNVAGSTQPDNRTFKCLLNCKKINRVYNSVSQIEGDLQVGRVGIRCWLFDQQHAVHGQWQYQKIELTRFAFRYNERSYSNTFLKTDPRNGEVSVVLSYLTSAGILSSERFKETMSDLCHNVGQQSQKIFNTMLEIIFGKEANDPYLTSVRVNPGYPRYMKVEKLLDKIKSLIATSKFYEIKADISSAHKNRSLFKKSYLSENKKLKIEFKPVQMALLYQLKFSPKYQENEDLKKNDKTSKGTQRDRNTTYFIKDYMELQEKNQIEFAKHLNQGLLKVLDTPALDERPADSLTYDQTSNLFQLTYGNQTIRARGRQMEPEEYKHEILILKAMEHRHPKMMGHLMPSNAPVGLKNQILCVYEQEQPLVQFLKKNSRTISLSTKLHIMSQICSFVQYLHKKNIRYFIELENIFITRGLEVRICGFKRSYRIQEKKEEGKTRLEYFMLRKEEWKEFPYRFLKEGDLESQKCDVMSLGVCLYRILMDKFPFFQKIDQRDWNTQEWLQMWTVETEYFLMKGGQLVKIIGHLILKCMEIEKINNRPFVEWLLVILCEIRTSLNGLY